MAFNQANQKGNLTTPKAINWENGQTYIISFYYKAISPTTNTTSNIKIFKNDGTKLSQVNFGLTSTSWVKYTTEYVSTVQDANGYVLFSINSNASGSSEFYFDDFVIEKKPIANPFFNDLKTKDVVSDQSIKWEQFGPGMSGNSTSLYTHPTDSDIVFSCPNMGNSYRSTDKGLTFETILNEDLGSYISGFRGPVQMFSLDFSRATPSYGFSTGERKGDLFQSVDKGKTWERQLSSQSLIGSSYLACVTVDPKNDNIWYLGAGRMRDYGRLEFPLSQPHGIQTDANSQGKIWKSTDKGQSWTLINSGLDVKAEVETIKVDPVNSNIVYATTNYGFYKSTNGGSTWVLKMNGMTNDVICSFDLHHNKSTNVVTLYALSNITWKANGNTVADDAGGIFKSTNQGETWTNVSGNLAVNLDYFKNNAGIKKSYYTTVAYYFGLATNAEAEAMFPVMPTSLTQRFNLITVDPKNANNIYLINNYSNASTNNFKPGQIWRTKDGGANWFVTLRNGKNWNNGVDNSYWSLRSNPMGTNVTFKYKSDWLNRDDYEQKGSNFARFSADGSVLYTQMAKIGFVSYDNGDNWLDIDDTATGSAGSWVGAGNSNLPGHGFYQSELLPKKVFCPSGENSLWITNQETNTVRPSAQSATVMDITSAEHSVSSIVVHPTDPNTWFATFFRQDKRGQILKTTNAGATWTSIGTPVPLPWPESTGGDQSVHQLSLLIDKNNPNYMYFCVPRSSIKLEWVGDSVTGWGVHRSTDGGVTWTEINTGLPASLDVARLAIDPNNTATLYAAVIDNGGGLFKSTDRGATWAEVASTLPISGSSGVNDIHFDKNGKAYITTGFKNEAINNGGLWVSDDNMQTWTKKFDYPWTNRVEVAKYDTNTILVSTLPNTQVNYKNAGTYLSKDAGETWIKINKGNGQSDRVNDIAIDYTVRGKFYASTRGSGWYTAIDPSALSTSKVSFKTKNSSYIYPNPVQNVFSIYGLSQQESNLSIYS
ncbi:WD40/YVTN/BNR-like repeat-containing protein, partial [Flavobacterium sp.]|uniref:WD40/YVTN/BNR-like repeat-containing protein n=1 Tax=Flavobacterium sp. TaxID=239 RepID=UPI003C5D22BF